MTTYPHKKPNHTTNLGIATRRLRWELPGNYPIFTLVMVINHYVKGIGEFLLIPFCITYTIVKNNIQMNQKIYIYNH